MDEQRKWLINHRKHFSVRGYLLGARGLGAVEQHQPPLLIALLEDRAHAVGEACLLVLAFEVFGTFGHHPRN